MIRSSRKFGNMHYVMFVLMFICSSANTNTVECNPVADSPLFTGYADTSAYVPRQDTSARGQYTGLPGKIVAFAKTQIGTRYQYCSMDPKGGFDCSGFVNYVFDHFGISVPRSSVDFTNVGTVVPLAAARPADLILFTGTNPAKRVVGHIGIIVENNNGDVSFIHSTSGKEYGVTISSLDKHYMLRFVKVIRIL